MSTFRKNWSKRSIDPKMAYVGRDRESAQFCSVIIEQLYHIERSVESSTAIGRDFKVPFVGQLYGSGKTRFGEEIQKYVNKNSEEFLHALENEAAGIFDGFVGLKKYFADKKEEICKRLSNAQRVYVKYDSEFLPLFKRNHPSREIVENFIIKKFFKTKRKISGDCFVHVDVIDKEMVGTIIRDFRDQCAEITINYWKEHKKLVVFLLSGRSCTLCDVGGGSTSSLYGTEWIVLRNLSLEWIERILKERGKIKENIFRETAILANELTKGIPRYLEYFILYLEIVFLPVSPLNKVEQLEEVKIGFLNSTHDFELRDRELGFVGGDREIFNFLYHSKKFGIEFELTKRLNLGDNYKSGSLDDKKNMLLSHYLNRFPLFVTTGQEGKVCIVRPLILEKLLEDQNGVGLQKNMFRMMSTMPSLVSDQSSAVDPSKLFEYVINVTFILRSFMCINENNDWSKDLPFFKGTYLESNKQKIKTVFKLPKFTRKGAHNPSSNEYVSLDKNITPERIQLMQTLYPCEDNFKIIISKIPNYSLVIFNEESSTGDMLMFLNLISRNEIQAKSGVLTFKMIGEETSKSFLYRSYKSEFFVGSCRLFCIMAMKWDNKLKQTFDHKDYVLLEENLYILYKKILFSTKREKLELVSVFKSNVDKIKSELRGKIEKLCEAGSISKNNLDSCEIENIKGCSCFEVLKDFQILILNGNAVKSFIGEKNFELIKSHKDKYEKNKLEGYLNIINGMNLFGKIISGSRITDISEEEKEFEFYWLIDHDVPTKKVLLLSQNKNKDIEGIKSIQGIFEELAIDSTDLTFGYLKDEKWVVLSFVRSFFKDKNIEEVWVLEDQVKKRKRSEYEDNDEREIIAIGEERFKKYRKISDKDVVKVHESCTKDWINSLKTSEKFGVDEPGYVRNKGLESEGFDSPDDVDSEEVELEKEVDSGKSWLEDFFEIKGKRKSKFRKTRKERKEERKKKRKKSENKIEKPEKLGGKWNEYRKKRRKKIEKLTDKVIGLARGKKYIECARKMSELIHFLFGDENVYSFKKYPT